VKKFLILSAVLLLMLPLIAQLGAQEPEVAANGVGYGGPRPPTPTGPVPRLPDGTVDLDGAWEGGGTVGDLERDGGLKKGEIDALLLPWARDLMSKRSADDDPHNFCMPDGVPRTTPFPFRFIQNYTHKAPTLMYILRELNIHTYRQIFMDGRKHPVDPDPTWMGHSIGFYENNKSTLVIDTIGYNDKWWFDRRGHPHTEQLHTIEKWTRYDYGHMENKVTIDDPGAYTKPFTVTFQAKYNPGDDLHEYICNENNQYGGAANLTYDPKK
jgi:hypothetical protein